MKTKIKLWGIKGSCPGTAENATRHGSNTSCIEVSNSKELIILDAGSGIVHLGQEKIDFQAYESISIFISHYHYDHIIGLPFFKQAYNSNLTFKVYGPTNASGGPETAIKGLFKQPYLPMGFDSLHAAFEFIPLQTGDVINTLTAKVTAFATDHPGGNLGYKVQTGGKVFSYITDLGHIPEIDSQLVEFVHESDFIYYDANFTESEYAHRNYEGWGHSTPDRGYKLLKDSHSKQLLIGHHALHRGDDELERLQELYKDVAHSVIVTKDFMSFSWEVPDASIPT